MPRTRGIRMGRKSKYSVRSTGVASDTILPRCSGFDGRVDVLQRRRFAAEPGPVIDDLEDELPRARALTDAIPGESYHHTGAARSVARTLSELG